MEKHYVFKSLFEDDITQVSSIGGKAEDYAEMRVPLDAHFPLFVRFETTRRLVVDNGCYSPELFNPIQYSACPNPSIPPDVRMSSKNALRYSSRIIVFKKRFHSKRSMLFRPTLQDDWRLQTALPSDVCFTTPPTKMSAMTLNVNCLIVSAPPCSNGQNSDCWSSPFAKKNPLIGIFCISRWHAIPMNPDRQSCTVDKLGIRQNRG
jgi:hypothetical protein